MEFFKRRKYFYGMFDVEWNLVEIEIKEKLCSLKGEKNILKYMIIKIYIWFLEYYIEKLLCSVWLRFFYLVILVCRGGKYSFVCESIKLGCNNYDV